VLLGYQDARFGRKGDDMKIAISARNFLTQAQELLIVPLFEGEGLRSEEVVKLDAHLSGLLSKLTTEGDFQGKRKEMLLLYPAADQAIKRVMLLGLGKRDKLTPERLRDANGKAVKRARSLVRSVSLLVTSDLADAMDEVDLTRCLADSAASSQYRFDRLRTEKEEIEPGEVEEYTIFARRRKPAKTLKEVARMSEIASEGVKIARDLANEPGNHMTPTRLAERAGEVAKGAGLHCKVLDERDMEKLGMGALLGVARGSAEPPRFIILEHVPKEKKAHTVVVVGKGITFDSGGISLKSRDKMEDMKYDMAGGGAVVGILHVAGRLGLPVHLVGLLPAAENLPGGRAIKPGDVLTAMSGKTIEIISTDAEGRLILADALCYAARYNPRAVIDLATLTGACVVALGSVLAGLFGNDRDLQDRLFQAGERSRERLWRLPLYEQYHKLLKSEVADMKNVGGRWGGAISAACFLSRFAEGYPWAHIDIAGTAWNEKERGDLGKGATGFGVRLILEYLTAEM
jgi:leucyl aminopeptidase